MSSKNWSPAKKKVNTMAARAAGMRKGATPMAARVSRTALQSPTAAAMTGNTTRMGSLVMYMRTEATRTTGHARKKPCTRAGGHVGHMNASTERRAPARKVVLVRKEVSVYPKRPCSSAYLEAAAFVPTATTDAASIRTGSIFFTFFSFLLSSLFLCFFFPAMWVEIFPEGNFSVWFLGGGPVEEKQMSNPNKRPKRTIRPPQPVYVPDEDIRFEDDYSEDSSFDEDELSEIDDSDSLEDLSSDDEDDDDEPNEYEYDDFLVPDDCEDDEEEGEDEEEEEEEDDLTDSDGSDLDDDEEEDESEEGSVNPAASPSEEEEEEEENEMDVDESN